MEDTGHHTLEVIAEASEFNKWMYKTINKYISVDDKILEIGSGIGNISNFFVKDNYNISFSDINNNYLSILKEKYGEKYNYFNIDIVDKDFEKKYKEIYKSFDVVYALNVIEHVDNDFVAISNLKKLLKKNGKLIILVPAYKFLFNSFDKNLEHKRRYTKKSLEKLVDKSGFKIVDLFYFNAFGIIGWFVFGNILKQNEIKQTNMRMYNLLMPVIKIFDKLLLNKVGLSFVIILEN
jgi:2-polyprenyl-3-methyl-5-hydroxy-6-metoxy-1,4-benzoquinol methylase